MISAREFFLQQMFPTWSNQRRELWFRSNKSAQLFLGIMQEYAQGVVDECIDSAPAWEEMSIDVTDAIDCLDIDIPIDKKERLEEVINQGVENIIEEIEKEMRSVYYKI